MNIVKTTIPDLLVIEPRVFEDDRGLFYESYNFQKLAELGLETQFVQDNHSFSKAGVLRGLHFQSEPMGQAKLVRCTKGKLWDVAVDVRKNSPTYKKWFGLELSAENKKMLYIPVGFLHGFYALTDCELQYKCSNYYSSEHDGSIIYNDPSIAIDWPLLNKDPIISDKDKNASLLENANIDFSL